MNDYLQKYDSALPSTQADFRITESYRWVRIGLFCLLAGYLFMPVGVVLAMSQTTLKAVEEMNPLMLLTGAAIMLLGGGLVLLGCVFLLQSPQENEKAAIRKVMFSYGVAICCLVAVRVFGIDGFDIVKRIAQAYGTYFLINFFQTLATNRENDLLQRSSNLLNRWYVFGLLGVFAFALSGQALGIPLGFFIAIIVVFAILFYGLWLRTLWLAIKSTRYIPADSERAFSE